MTTPPNRPRGSARIPAPEPDGPGGYRARPFGSAGSDAGRRSAGRYGAEATGRYGAESTGRYGAESTGRHGAGSAGRSGAESTGRHGGESTGRYGAESTGRHGAGSTGRHGSESTGRYRVPEEPSGRHSRGGDDGSSRSYGRRLGEEPSGRHSRDGSGGTGRAAAGASSAGRASVGSASVGAGASGRASAGRASVGSASVGGSAGRATVRPAGPGGAGDALGPPRSRAEERLAAKDSVKSRKKRRRRRRIVAGVAVLLLLAGIGTIGGAYYFTSVPLPGQLQPQVPSTFYYSDGKTPMARLGAQNGSHVDVATLPKPVKYAVVAAEDRSFYQNSGVDFKGILRATWGHLMGEEDSGGASTITMQYAKLIADRRQDNRTYTEKLKESVMAMKLDQKYSKDTILGYYLDLAYFNRGAYGLEAAAKTYFSKEAKDLTPEQAAVLAAVIKDPTVNDPANNPDIAKARWKYVLRGMKDLGVYHKPISQAVYPKANPPDPNSNGASMGLDKPTGLVVTQVEHELVNKGVFKREGKDGLAAARRRLQTGGYKIVTTIDRKAQRDAVSVGNKEMKGEHKNLANAIVAVEPNTGDVKAYFGGNDGQGYDTAASLHPPGSSMKVYVLAAALNAGYSIKSYWNGDSSEKFKDRGGDGKVHNSEETECSNGGVRDGHNVCSLIMAVKLSLNTVFYKLTQLLGKDTVIKLSHDAGINYLKTVPSDPKDVKVLNLNKVSAEYAAKQPGVGNEIGFGQNPITPLDHANGLATFANKGVYTEAHFIKTMTDKNDKLVYKYHKVQRRVFSADAAADIDYVLEQVATHESQKIQPHRPQANKTGTWQYKNELYSNSHAWTVGYVPQLACAVWVGALNGGRILNNRGTAMYGWDLPGRLWAKFMTKAVRDMHMKAKDFPPPKYIGDPTKGQFDGPQPKKPKHSKSATPSSSSTPSSSGSPSSPPTGFPTGPQTPPGSSSPCSGWLCDNNGQPQNR